MNNWAEENTPWIDNDNFPRIIVEKANFVALLDKFKIEYMTCASGDFTHKLKCPLPIHSGGEERTPSCYFSETTNRFHCFGCNSGSNIIDFVKLYTGKPYLETLKWLAEFVGITESDIPIDEAKRESKNPEHTIKIWILRAGLILRQHLEQHKSDEDYEQWCVWADKRFNKMDELMNLPDKEWEKAKAYHTKIKEYLDGHSKR